MPNELLVRVARTDYADASLRSCSEHEFPWRARAQPKLRSEFIPSTSAPATETQPSRNSTSPNSCSSLSEKCPTTDQWASHGKLTNHGAQQGEIVRRDKSIALKDDSQRYQEKRDCYNQLSLNWGIEMFPPGRARLATNPLPTGSQPASSQWESWKLLPWRHGCWRTSCDNDVYTSSAASAGRRSTFPS